LVSTCRPVCKGSGSILGKRAEGGRYACPRDTPLVLGGSFFLNPRSLRKSNKGTRVRFSFPIAAGRTFAAGCSTSRSLRIVAPSLVIVTSPMSSTSILSKPTGPSDVLTMFATACTAMTVVARNKRARRGGKKDQRQCLWVDAVQMGMVESQRGVELWSYARRHTARREPPLTRPRA
jgi:hypothetical protein